MLVYARGMGGGTHIVNVSQQVQEAILDAESHPATVDCSLQTATRAARLRAASL
jgi:seryl-tRNA(Sec) selenium transferase